MRTGLDLLHKAAKISARCLTIAATLNQLKSRLDSRSGEGFYAVVKSGILTTEQRGVYEACMPNPISLHAFYLFNHNRGLENYMHVWNLVTALCSVCLCFSAKGWYLRRRWVYATPSFQEHHSLHCFWHHVGRHPHS